MCKNNMPFNNMPEVNQPMQMQNMRRAQAQVRCQNLNCVYPPMEGLYQGTIFPELAMPYENAPEHFKIQKEVIQMDPTRENLLKEIMSSDFTCIDLNLYLDTHPCDQRALMLYNTNVQKSKMLREKYERMYGPLTPLSLNYGNSWRWVESPWPWEK